MFQERSEQKRKGASKKRKLPGAAQSSQIAITQARYHLTGQTPGATIYFRVLACDPDLPNGQSAYSGWVAILVGV